jgi:acyl carrier protein
MERNDFVQNFANQFEDADISNVSIKSNFRDIEGWSSLTALSIIAMVDESYKVRLTGDDIRSSKTIEDVYEIVKSRL